MSVVGIGNDIVQIKRLAAMNEQALERLALRILTPNEYRYYKTLKFHISYLAKRWAGKEAAAKALGTGIAEGVSFQHFEIASLASGQPQLILTEVALNKAKSLQANSWHISLSDEKDYATAFVVLSK
ncbi:MULTISPECIES: holo-ACP synthase [Thalassotalea]|uniref:Holo-[acyl-carrier-protein] synthase n=1 Tax=Thalassotalea castellviae TaxID=3075612 RepID=A0ABU3A022_9GAMM|nr:holo-ACP synthase [Thalassotalea sp. W431]MDT0603533.1 holo-ACP synthase [Thalassotalea sp. W431]